MLQARSRDVRITGSAKVGELSRAYQRWKDSNEAYLAARLKYDAATAMARAATEQLRLDFLRKKERVKIATEQYYAVVNADRPVTLTQQEEKLLFTEQELSSLKEKAAEIKKAQSQVK